MSMAMAESSGGRTGPVDSRAGVEQWLRSTMPWLVDSKRAVRWGKVQECVFRIDP